MAPYLGDARIGDARAQIEALFRRHAAGVGGYVIARTGDPELAEVITSRVFTLVVRKFHQCGDGQAAQTAWLWAIVRNELARYFRDRKSHTPLDETVAQHAEDDKDEPSEAMQRQELHERLHDAMAHLSEEQQQILYLKYFQDMPNKRIAEVLATTPNNVGVKVHRTLKVLRALLGDHASSIGAASAALLARSDNQPDEQPDGRDEIFHERSG